MNGLNNDDLIYGSKGISLDDINAGVEAKDDDSQRADDTAPENNKGEPDESGKKTDNSKAPEKENKDADVVEFDAVRNYFKSKMDKDVDEDFISSIFEREEKLSKTGDELSALKEKLNSVSKIADKVNGREWFISDDEFIRQQFLKKNKEKYSEAALGVLSNLTPQKVKELDPVEAIKTKVAIDNPDLTKHEVEEFVLDKLGISDSEDELGSLEKAKIKVEATAAKKELSALYDGIKIPDKVDFSKNIDSIKEKWNDSLTNLVKDTGKLKLSENYEFDVSDSMKDGAIEKLMSKAIDMEVNEDSLKKLAFEFKRDLVVSNLDKIISSVERSAIEREKENWKQKLNNSSDLNDARRESSSDKKTNDDIFLNL